MPRYKITIEYEGTNYCGWQEQKNQRSIQGEIKKAIKKFAQEIVVVYGSGRTDSGVHALDQVAHFDLEKQHSSELVTKALNFYLRPQPISILKCEEVKKDFHARFSAKKRYYRYHIINRLPPLTIDENRAWHVIESLDLEKMREAAKVLEGTHDFSNFRASACQSKFPVKTIDYIDIFKRNQRIIFEISSRSFLHNMVRNIIGVLQKIGSGKSSIKELQGLLSLKEQKVQKFTAPALGLYLYKVEF